MKVAILSESTADRAALHVFLNSLLRQATELYDRRVPVSGWTGVFEVLPAAVKELHFNAHDVDGLIAVVDSDLTAVHHPDHETTSGGHPDCRLCRLHEEARRVQSRLSVTSRKPIKFAFGLAVPCIEVWFRCGHDSTITEAGWELALRERKFPYDSQRLKRAVYGTDRPARSLQRERMVAEATRLAADISVLEKWFPNGFGPFAAAVRGWQRATK